MYRDSEPVSPYAITIETSTGKSANVPIVFLTQQQVESFLQLDFNRLVQEAGVKGARIHVERAVTADYDKVLGDLAACLKATAKPDAQPHPSYGVVLTTTSRTSRI